MPHVKKPFKLFDHLHTKSAELSNPYRASFHKKGWGHEIWIANSPLYCGKLLHFDAGKLFSLHYHVKKTETMYLASGHLKVKMLDPETSKEHVFEMLPGDSLLIPPGYAHQIGALEASDLFEFSTQHFEDDSYRIEKGD